MNVVNKHPLMPAIIVVFLLAVFLVGFLPNTSLFIALKLLIIFVLGGSAFFLSRDLIADLISVESEEEDIEPEISIPDSDALPELPEIKTAQNIEEYFELFLSTIFPVIKQTVVCDTVALLMINFQRKQFYIRHRLTEYADQFTDNSFIDINQGLMALVLRNKKTIIEAHLPDNKNLLPYYNSSKLPARSFIGAPLFFNDTLVGVLCVDSHVEASFSPEDAEILEEMCKVIGIQLACSNRLYEYETENWTTRLLYDFSKGVLNIQSSSDLWQYIHKTISPVFSAARITIAEKSGKQSGKIVFTAGEEEAAHVGTTFPDDEGLVGWVLRKDQSLIVDDFSAKENYIPRLHLNEVQTRDQQSFLAVPVIIDNETAAVIAVESNKPHHYSDQHKKILETMAYQVASFLKKEQTIAQLRKKNLVDVKTGLGNHKAFKAELEKEIRRSAGYNKYFCLQFLKIMPSNNIADSEAFERLISEFVSFVLPLLDSAAYIFRLQDSHLAVLWPEKTLDETINSFQEIYQEIEAKKPWVGGIVEKLYMNGGTVSFPEKGKNAEELIANANEALRKSELKGPNTIEVYQKHEKIETQGE